MRMRRWATMRRPASSMTVLTLPVRLRRVASGLMIEKVRSVMEKAWALSWGGLETEGCGLITMAVRAAKARAWEDDRDAAPGGNKTDALAPTGRTPRASST